MSRVSKDVRTFPVVSRKDTHLDALRRHPNPLAAAIGQSIYATLNYTVTEEEEGWIDRIEAHRAELSKSEERVVCMDYGAGKRESRRTAQEMAAGVAVENTVGHFCRVSSKGARWCGLLFRLIRAVRPRSCVEMGAAVGISAAYQAAALHLNAAGSLITMEGAAPLAAVARQTLHHLGLENATVMAGKFMDTLPSILKQQPPIDYVFVDGHHDEAATQAYAEQLFPFLADQALLVFDDIAWNEPMKRAWQAIANDDRIHFAIDLGTIGIGLVAPTYRGPRFVSFPLE